MTTFGITIQRQVDARWPVVVEQTKPGESLPVRSEGSLELSLAELRLTSREEYGIRLGQSLFRDAVRDAFVRARGESRDDLHVLLSIEADNLKNLRWERLWGPMDGNRWSPLALDQRVPFSMYLPSLADRRFPPIGRRDLSALIVAACPNGLDQWRLDPFDAALAVSSVRRALDPIPVNVLAMVEGAIGPPTLDALCRAITGESYTLLHIVCHGRYSSSDGEPLIFLSSPNGEVDAVTASQVIKRLSNVSGARGLPHFAFLSSCESAAPEAEGVLGGLAQRLVRELGMLAVVAMTDKVTVASALALGSEFYARMRRHGEVDRALVESYAGLAERPDIDIPVPALFGRLGGLPLFNLGIEGDLSNSEIANGLNRLESFLPERAPVLLPEFKKSAGRLREMLGTDKVHLSGLARQQREESLETVSKLCLEALDRSFKALASDEEPGSYDNRCPFRGLNAFGAEDREFFFGRETWTAKLKARLADHKFLSVLGNSGSGKSSVVLAGLIPLLQDEEPGLRMLYLTPGHDPLATLESSLATVQDQTTVLVIDQFEELFTLCADKTARRKFLDRLLENASRMRVIITMRADFWGDCASHPALRERMLAHQVLIAPMDVEELRRAMEQQANAVGLRFETGLIGVILDDVEEQPGAMPLLQHALLELWNQRQGRWLKGERYQAIGRAGGAIAKTAEAVYAGLDSDREREIAQDIFLGLIHLDEEAAPQEHPRDTRRRATLAELLPVDDKEMMTRAVVNRLADRHLVVTGRNEKTGQVEVELAHEAIIRHWPLLRDWIEKNREILRIRGEIRELAKKWNDKQRDKTLLYHREDRLDEVVSLIKSGRLKLRLQESQYIESCQELSREADDARWWSLAIRRLGVVTIAGLIIAAFAIRWWDDARLADEQKQQLVLKTRLVDEKTHQLDRATRSQYALQLNKVASTWRSNPAHGLELLDDSFLCPEGLREFAWHYLHRLCQPLRPFLDAHDDEVGAVAFAPDGETLASGSHDRTIKLWDVHGLRVLANLPRQTGEVSCLAFSPLPETHFLASGGADGTIKLWEIQRKNLQVTVVEHDHGVHSVAFSPDGRTLVSGGADRTIKIWDVPRLRVHSVAFSPDGRTLVSGGADRTIKIWDVPGLRVQATLPKLAGRVLCVVFSPDGRILASGGRGQPITLWDVAPWGARLTIPAGEDDINSLAFSPDGHNLASGGRKGNIKLWDTIKGSWLGTLDVMAGEINSLAYSPDGCYLAAGCNDSSITLWDTKTQQKSRTLKGHTNVVRSVAFAPDGKTLASSGGVHVRIWDAFMDPEWATLRTTGSGPVTSLAFSPQPSHPTLAAGGGFGTGEVNLYDAGDKRWVKRLNGRFFFVHGVAFSCDGTILASAAAEPKIKLWHQITGLEHSHIDPPGFFNAECVTFSPVAPTILAWGDSDGVIRIWDVEGRKELKTVRVLNGISGLAFSPDGRTLASAGRSDPIIRLWDMDGMRVRDVLQDHKGGVRCVAFARDNQTLAAGLDDNSIALWNTTTKGRLTLRGHTSPVLSVAFSPDGRTLASAGEDRTVRLWDAVTGPERVVLEGHKESVYAVAFSPDGRILASASQDGTVKLWKGR